MRGGGGSNMQVDNKDNEAIKTHMHVNRQTP